MNLRRVTFLLFATCNLASCLEPPPTVAPSKCDMTSMDMDMSMTARKDASQNMCTTPCSQGLTRCDASSCVDTQTDTSHCGACGVACEAGFVCTQGSCACPDGQESCDGTCVDTMADDPDNCGGCGITCPNVSCRAGECLCGVGKMACGGSCVDIQNNDSHCGGCDVYCGLGCKDSQCARIVALGTHRRHACIVINDGDVYCWGQNAYGETGQGISEKPTISPQHAKAFDGLDVVDVGLGDLFTCALTREGDVHCLGLGSASQLATEPKSTNTQPVQVSLMQKASAISVGFAHVCALLEDRTIVCWGKSNDGRLGTGIQHANDRLAIPGAVTKLTDVTAIDLGHKHSCAIVEKEQGLYCWGKGASFRLGTGSEADTLQPGDAPVATGVAQVSAGGSHTCYVDTMGAVFCVGDNIRGQTGVATGATQTTFVEVTSLPGPAIWVEAGFQSTCALLQDKSVWCWGDNTENQLGGGRSRPQDTTPRPVVGAENIKRLRMGDQSICAVTGANSLLCWGANGLHQLGYGIAGRAYSPQFVSIRAPWRRINRPE